MIFRSPVVQELLELMEFRNTHAAFNLEGTCETQLDDDHVIAITRRYEDDYAILKADLKTYEFEIEHS